MNFKEVLTKLNIEDYSERIFNSNSHGELFHLQQYFTILEILKEDTDWFRDWFEKVIKFTKEKWENPESVYRHILEILIDENPNIINK